MNGIRTHGTRHVACRRGSRRSGDSPERTYATGPTLDLVELVVLGDRLVRREVTTPDPADQRPTTGTGPVADSCSARPGWCARASTRRRSRAFACSSSWPGCRSPPSTTSSGTRRPVSGCGGSSWHTSSSCSPSSTRVGGIASPTRSGKGTSSRREELDHRTWRVVEVIAEEPRRRPASGPAADRAGPSGSWRAPTTPVLRGVAARSSRASTPHADNPHVMTCGTESPKCRRKVISVR